MIEGRRARVHKHYSPFDMEFHDGRSDHNKEKVRDDEEEEGVATLDITYLVDPGTYMNLEFASFQYVLIQDLYPAHEDGKTGDVSQYDTDAFFDPFRGGGQGAVNASLSGPHKEGHRKTSFASISGVTGRVEDATNKRTAVVNSHEPNHLPTKFVAYAWQDTSINFNNHTGKPLIRLRDFCYSVTTRHVDVQKSHDYLTQISHHIGGADEGGDNRGQAVLLALSKIRVMIMTSMAIVIVALLHQMVR